MKYIISNQKFLKYHNVKSQIVTIVVWVWMFVDQSCSANYQSIVLRLISNIKFLMNITFMIIISALFLLFLVKTHFFTDDSEDHDIRNQITVKALDKVCHMYLHNEENRKKFK